MSQPRRNEPCPCGSGKRYKHCCGATEAAPVPETSSALLAVQARQALDARRDDEAEALCVRILQRDAANAEALHMLGVVANRRGDGVRAQASIEKALALDPTDASYHQSLGTAYLEQGKLADAATCYRKALELRPDFAEACLNLGYVLGEQGREEEALTQFELAARYRPDFPAAHFNLAASLHMLGRLDEALHHYRRALDLEPDHSEACLNIGSILSLREQPYEALAWFERSAALRPADAEAHYRRAKALHSLGRHAEAGAAYQRAIDLRPEHADAVHDMGILRRDENDLAGARACFEREVELRPDDAEAHFSLGTVLNAEGSHKRAEACLQQSLLLNPDRALELNPAFADAYVNLGGAYMAQGRMEEAVALFRRALEVDPADALARSNLLLALQYASHLSVDDVFAEHCAFGAVHEAAAGALMPHGNARDKDKRIRIGYLSPDFRQHAVAYFAETVLGRHDHRRFEVYGYYSRDLRHGEDNVTARFRGYCDHWREIEGLDDEAAAALIRADGIDILVDLAGHTSGNRLGIFARKPAPVQATWLGHPNTTGLTRVDYRFSDAYAEPEGLSERLNSETLWRLPEIFCCYTPCAAQPERVGSAALEVRPAPALEKGYITFGCCNNIAKVSPPAVALWAKLLHAVPSARLLLEANFLETPLLRDLVRARFAAHGIGAERLELLGRRSEQQYVLYHEIDIALDPFPCVGGTTSFDALWMGVPLVTLAGPTFVSRMGVSLLSNLGLRELIAADEDAYVAVAAGLANDLERLNGLRLGLRARMEASPLMDAGRFATHMERAYREMWARWCGKQ